MIRSFSGFLRHKAGMLGFVELVKSFSEDVELVKSECFLLFVVSSLISTLILLLDLAPVASALFFLFLDV